MYFVFADDAKQEHPTRERMGPLVSAGALLVDSTKLRDLETAIEKLCKDAGFPVEDPRKSEFKWSPGSELWMKKNLVGSERERFFLSVVNCLREAEVKTIVAIDDTHASTANESRNGTVRLTHEQDATYLLFERINRFVRELGENAVVINDRPSGGDENKFLAEALEMWRKGTRFVKFDRIAINLLCTQSRFVRLLQCADLVTSCITAHVSGEHLWSPRVFAAIRPLLCSKDGRMGGSGLKFNTTRHRNLYHWLLGDATYHASGTEYPLPFDNYYDHPRPTDFESWRIFLEVVEMSRKQRPLIAPYLERARPGDYTKGDFELRFEEREAWETINRPLSRKFLSRQVSEIDKTETSVKCLLVSRFK
jgi:hypothetical protein